MERTSRDAVHVWFPGMMWTKELNPESSDITGAARSEPGLIASEAADILRDPQRAERMQTGYERVRKSLGGGAGITNVASEALALMARGR